MRPYLAILEDSVREAVRSRTLPFLLLFFTLVLAAVAPLGLRDETAWELNRGDVRDAPLLTARLRRDAAKGGEQPGDRVLARLPADVRDAVLNPPSDDAADANPDAAAERLRVALNAAVLTSTDLYDAAAFADVRLGGGRFGGPPFGGGGGGDEPAASEAERLLEAGPADLSADRRGRLNRLLLNAAFPQTLAEPVAEQVTLTYAGYELPGNFTEDLAGSSGLKLNRNGIGFIAKILMSLVAGYLAGPIGVLIALLVTAGLIPQTFEGGAIDLLLSKPVNRSLTFLTKFAGGCIFVALAGLYLCTGLWLIAGVRLGVWDGGIVAAAGVLVAEFAVLYAVSAAVGVLWRNPIVCVMAAGAVWALSWGLNVVYALSKQHYDGERPAAVVEVAGDDGGLFRASATGSVGRWDAAKGSWEPALYDAAGPAGAGLPVYRLSGPEFSPETGELTGLEIRAVSGGRGSGPPREIDGSRRFYAASAAGDWAGRTEATAPPGTDWLLLGRGGEPLFAGPAGVYRLKPEAPEAADAGFFGSLLGELSDAVGPFLPVVTPAGGDGRGGGLWPEPFAAAADPATGDLAVLAGGVLRVYRDGGTDPAVEVTLFEPPAAGPDGPAAPAAGLPAVAGGAVLVVAADGTGKRVAADGAVSDFAPVPGERPAAWARSADGATLALRTHAGSVWVGDGTGAGGVVTTGASAAGFAPDGGLWVGTSANRVTKLSDGDWAAGRTVGPPPGWYELIYRYSLVPLHYLLPDTSALGAVMTGLFTDGADGAAFGDDADLREPGPDLGLQTGPLVHNLSFMAAILLLTCWHVSRTDF